MCKLGGVRVQPGRWRIKRCCGSLSSAEVRWGVMEIRWTKWVQAQKLRELTRQRTSARSMSFSCTPLSFSCTSIDFSLISKFDSFVLGGSQHLLCLYSLRSLILRWDFTISRKKKNRLYSKPPPPPPWNPCRVILVIGFVKVNNGHEQIIAFSGLESPFSRFITVNNKLPVRTKC